MDGPCGEYRAAQIFHKDSWSMIHNGGKQDIQDLFTCYANRGKVGLVCALMLN